MNQRTLIDRLLSPAGFGLVLLLFVLPFATVSCGVESQKVDATFTGLDFVLGGQPSISGPNVDAEAESQLAALFEDDYHAEPLAVIAAVLLLTGMAIALLPRRQTRTWASAATAAVTVALLTIAVFVRAPSRVNEAMDQFRATANLDQPVTTTTSPAIGFWVAIVLLLALAVWQGYEAVRAPSLAVPAAEPPAAELPPAGAGLTPAGPPGALPPTQAPNPDLGTSAP